MKIRTFLIASLFSVLMITCFSSCESDAPNVPHEVVNTDDESCLSCHENGDNNAPVMSHSKKSNCLRCHDDSD